MQERLQKIISRAGIASRRHAEDLIRSGQVRVNGVVITELGAKADPERDRVEAAGRVAQLSDTHVYLLMHKPPDVVSTLADPEGRRTLRNFLVGVAERVFPVGRLDYAASGVVFLTNDGDFASRMLKASPFLPQALWVKVKGRVSDVQLRSLAHTVQGKIFPLRGTHAAGKNPPNPWYEAQIPGGRREMLRRNLLAIGHTVEKVKRMKLASLDVDTVEEGHYRQLAAPEVAKLSRAIDLALTQHQPSLKGFKPRREWRPRSEMLKKGINSNNKEQGAVGKEQSLVVREPRADFREQRPVRRDAPTGGREQRPAARGHRGGDRPQRPGRRDPRTDGREQRPAAGGQRTGGREQRPGRRDPRTGGREQRPEARGQRTGGREQRPGRRDPRTGGREQRPEARGQRTGGRQQRPSGRDGRAGGRDQNGVRRGHRPGGRERGVGGRGPVKPA